MKFMKRLSLFLLVVALLVTMIPSAFAANSFTDVRSTDWFSDAVSYVQERGLMSGTSATHFSPSRQPARCWSRSCTAPPGSRKRPVNRPLRTFWQETILQTPWRGPRKITL